MRLPYSLATLWYERNRYQSGVLAVAFSFLLSAIQCGLMLGLFSIVSIPIDRSAADVWVGYPGVDNMGVSLPIPDSWRSRLALQPEVERTEVYLQGVVPWRKPHGGVVTCVIIGARLDDQSLGAVRDLTPELRSRLSEFGSIVVDEGDLDGLGLEGVGDETEVMGRRVRIVGLVRGLKGLGATSVYCSVETARSLLHFRSDQSTYLLARCRRPEDVKDLVLRLRQYGDMTVYTREEFSLSTRMYWLTKTKAGIALGITALLGLLVGAVVTSQTLYAATLSSLREYAVLDALGISTARMAAMVLTQSFWVGLLGLLLGLPAVLGLARVAEAAGTKVLIPFWLLGLTGLVTLGMALFSGLVALRSLRLIEPVALLR
jgi:putative ABC transport system permease protein